MINLEELLTAKDVAKAFQCSIQHVNRLRKRGDLQGLAIGGMWRYHPKDLRDYIEKQRKTRFDDQY